jgi:transposase
MNSLRHITFPPRGFSRPLRIRILRFLLLGWTPHAIAADCRVSLRTVQRFARNLLQYGSIRVPAIRKLGRPRRLTTADEDAVLEMLLSEGWRQQEEIVFWLWCERGVLVHRSTVSRMLKRRKWTQKELRRISLGRSDELRQNWKEEMRQYAAEDLVFFDESIFNEKTGWRYRAYGPIGQDIRYPADVQRGRTWSICAAMTIDGWIPCTGVKQGYFQTPDLLNWLRSMLLPALRSDPDRPRVVVLDNNSTHVNEVIIDAIEADGHIVRFLPPYSPDFNPIELTFSVLKAWLQRNYVWTRSSFERFGDYLIWAIGYSRCDRFAREQFRHAAGGIYLEEGEIERFRIWLRDWENGTTEMGTTEMGATEDMEVREYEEEEIIEVLEGIDGVEDTIN